MLTGNRRAATGERQQPSPPPSDRSQPQEQEGFKPENHLHACYLRGRGGAVCDGKVRGDPFRTNEEETPSLTCRERGEKGHSL